MPPRPRSEKPSAAQRSALAAKLRAKGVSSAAASQIVGDSSVDRGEIVRRAIAYCKSNERRS